MYSILHWIWPWVVPYGTVVFCVFLTMQLLMSTKPGLQNLQLWAADRDEKRKKHKKHHISWITSHSFRSDVLPRTLLWVQLQLHCWATVHTRTGSQMTACGCRRSCYRERASSRGRHHWRTFPPVKEKETLVKLTVKISEKQCSVWQYINFTLFQSSFWLDMIKNPPSSIK